MITAARPSIQGPAHYYYPSGKACWDVPNKSKPGESRNTTVKDARALGLIPSPTTVLKLLHRHALVEWLVEQAVLAAVTTPIKNGELLDDYVHRVINFDRVQDEERNAAAERGKAIHKTIQCAISRPGEKDWMEGDYMLEVKSTIEALRSIGRVVATEKVIVGDGYAGMTDCILENDTEIWDVDFKSCRNIPDRPYDEQKLQVASYCGGLGNTGNKTIRGMLIYVSTTEPGKVKAVEVENWQAHYERFKLLLHFFKATHNLS